MYISASNFSLFVLQLLLPSWDDNMAVDPEKVGEPPVRESNETNTSTMRTSTTQPPSNGDKIGEKPVQPPVSNGNFPPLKDIPVEDLYDHDKYDLTTMEVTDLFRLLE